MESTVIFFATPRGNSPVAKFLRELKKSDVNAAGHFVALIRNLQEKGRGVNTGSRSLSDGLFELRSTRGNGQYRIIYFFHDNGAVLLSGFEKKTRTTPKSELDLARKRRQQFKADPDTHSWQG